MAGAPITQVIITVQFATALRALNALEISEIYQAFASDFPVYEQIAAAGPMPYKLTQLDGTEPVDYEMPNIPRLSLSAPDRGRLIMIQHDRFSCGWQRTVPLGDEDGYPGFAEILSLFASSYERFLATVEEITEVRPKAKVAEIAYVNAFLTRTPDGDKVRLSDLYTFIRAAEVPVSINGYQYTWNERLRVADGVLVVTVSGPVKLTDGVPASSFALTSTYLIKDEDRIEEEMLAVRARSGETFRRVVGFEGVGL